VTRSLTAVFAHPDDETFATGGTLAKYAEQGVRCSLYSATDGDAGRSSGIPVSSREELGRIRRAELIEACTLLGIGAIDHGGHPDGALSAADPEVVIGQIVLGSRGRMRDSATLLCGFGPGFCRFGMGLRDLGIGDGFNAVGLLALLGLGLLELSLSGQ